MKSRLKFVPPILIVALAVTQELFGRPPAPASAKLKLASFGDARIMGPAPAVRLRSSLEVNVIPGNGSFPGQLPSFKSPPLASIAPLETPGQPLKSFSEHYSGRIGAVPRPSAPALRIASKPLPLAFEPNQGQTAAEVRYLSRAPGCNFFITDRELVMVFEREASAAIPHNNQFLPPTARGRIEFPHLTREVMRFKLAGTSGKPSFEAAEPMTGRVNYFIGNDPKKWRTRIPLYGRVVEHAAWRGIDVAWYGKQNQVESDFIVAPNADPKAIQLAVNGAAVKLDSNGDLNVGAVTLHKPVIYQQIGRERRPIVGRYILAGNKLQNRIGFEIASYDHTHPLVIDPIVTLGYSTYLGGTGQDAGTDIAVDSTGSATVVGFTTWVDFPTQNPFQSSNSTIEAFVTKFSVDGTSLIYSTYLGGKGTSASGVALDSAGSAYVTGSAGANFPITPNAAQTTYCNHPCGNASNSFVTKLSVDGSSLVYSTYLGGSTIVASGGVGNGGVGLTNDIAVDASGSAYVTGMTTQSDFPATPGAFQVGSKATTPLGFQCVRDQAERGW